MFGDRRPVSTEYFSEFGCWIMEWDRKIGKQDYTFQMWFTPAPKEAHSSISHVWVYGHQDKNSRPRYYAWS